MVDWTLLIFTRLYVLVALLAGWVVVRLRSTRHGADYDFIRGLQDAAFMLNQQHTIVDFNNAARKLVTDSPHLIGQPISQALAHMPEVVVCCKTGEAARFETVCNAPEHVFYETTITPLLNWRGQAAGQLLTLRDITARHLTQLRQQLLVETGALLSASPDAELPLHEVAQLVVNHHLINICAIYLKDPDGLVHVFGASSHLNTAFPCEGEEAVEVMRAWQPALDGSIIVVPEVNSSSLFRGMSAKAADYLSQLRSVVCVPLRADEQTLGALLLATIHGSRELDAHDTTVTESLAQQIVGAIKNHDRFAALQASEASYRAASVEAAHASIAKSAFLTMMSHEIRTPLMGVLGIADLLGRTNGQSEQNELLNILIRNAHSLRTTIADILDIAKIEAGKLDLVNEPVDLVQCIEDAVNTVAFQASEKGLDLTYQLDAGIPSVILTDYVRLRQILMNLLSNAVKFTERGAITICVTSDGPSRPQCGAEIIRFTVQDTGIGIAPEHCAHIFDAFYQTNHDSHQHYGGAGIGLTINKQLCELMGGTIDVESRMGEGSTFSCTIAAAPVPDVQSRMPVQTVPLLNGKDMLIIGAAAAEQAMLATQAQHWGMRVHTVTTTAEALWTLRAGIQHDVIVVGSSVVKYVPHRLAEIHQLAAIEPEQPIITLLPLTHVWDETYTVPDNMVVQTCPVKLSAFYELLMRLVQSSDSAVSVTPTTITATPRTPLRMLIVDDNQTNCMLMEYMLNTLGYHADVVTNGDAALRALQRNIYDIAWLDVNLTGSGLDGLEVVRLFNELQKVISPYFVAVTASATLQDRTRCLAAGMHDYLCKPINRIQLEEVIDRAYEWLYEPTVTSTDTASHMPQLQEKGTVAQSSSNERACYPATSTSPVKTPSGYMLPERIVTTFFTEAKEMLLDMRRAIIANDVETLCATLHRLKSSSWYIAGSLMAQSCQLFEELIRLEAHDHWEEAMCELEDAFSHAHRAMRDAAVVNTPALLQAQTLSPILGS